MKVVLFCGGLGTRLREHSDTVPKPLVNIGSRPILFHLMRYYAHYGHKEFILCLGYLGDMIKEFFLKHNDAMHNDFVLHGADRRVELLGHDMDDWRITFVDTGLHSNLGQRLLAVKQFIGNDEVFLANYSDGLSDLPLDRYIERALESESTASFVSVRTSQSFHAVHADEHGVVHNLGRVGESEFRINGGFFVLRRDIFSYIQDGEELVEEPFQRLIKERKLFAYKHEGFWAPMDTFKDKVTFDRMYARGQAPWEVWRRQNGATGKKPK
jgi:glucose-1-phosphate cytidylyltransferase